MNNNSNNTKSKQTSPAVEDTGKAIQVENLTKQYDRTDSFLQRFFGTGKKVDAVRNVNFTVQSGEVFGLVGESGCGKTTTAHSILQLERPTEGSIWYDGVDLTTLSDSDLKSYRQEIQIIFQGSTSSLNPSRRIGQILREPMQTHDRYTGRRDERIAELLENVGLSPDIRDRYPHEFSGGQRQRIGIARALAVDPEFLIADEPVSALDLSTQAQILNLLSDLCEMYDLTILFITHDMRIVHYMCDRVAVMYLGEIVEKGKTEQLLTNPQHPYTEALVSAIPSFKPTDCRERTVLHGEPSSPIDPPSGCRFHPRCPEATEECADTDPSLKPVDNAPEPHSAACIHIDEYEYMTNTDPFETFELMERYSVESFGTENN